MNKEYGFQKCLDQDGKVIASMKLPEDLSREHWNIAMDWFKDVCCGSVTNEETHNLIKELPKDCEFKVRERDVIF